ncbi:phosphoribosyl-ATP pyrophosphatase [Hathewaya proteolytica DSM 3090]|uniref:Phosphoribosyl-ATP pyrophosphatase n=1 Tax=Hathewaya proteolytica DSM 3090 TaxID=1121331 RepID=A0A1M6RGB9_9CLOT|nr:phosphoribosyl-ATP diphosphatase [Hathewaya proteolytica]SHK31521.1 phosphoribosyl-ATP pyrophosphatase [Hathewaya proteolytica DSM 3090]
MEEFNKLYEIIKQRKSEPEEGSYTTYLFETGLGKILKKVGEESTEVVISALKETKEEQVGEICDVLYHLMVLLVELNIPMEDIEEELKKRSAKTHNLKCQRKDVERL